MKKILLVAAAAAGLVSIAPAFAADGTINFTGTVTAQTCKINSAASPANINLTLPTVSATALNAAESTAGNTPFAVTLSECATGAGAPTQARMYFEAGPNITTAGTLRNTAATNPAANVQIRLLNGDESVIDLSKTTTAVAQGSKPATISGGAATLNYVAQYIAKGGAAGAGAVASSVTFTMQYQ